MGKASFFDNLREWISGITFNVFLWSIRMTQDQYLRAVCNQPETAGEQLIEAAQGLMEYRRQAGPLNFQLEKADTFIFRMAVALEAMGVLKLPEK